LFKTDRLRARKVFGMSPTFDAIGLAVADMATSLRFYRRLGLDIPPRPTTLRTPRRNCPGAYG
jgi:hypothetical protein